MNKSIKYGLVNAMTGITCAAITAAQWEDVTKFILVAFVVVVVSVLSGAAIAEGEEK